jgi:hypothetical protein
MARTKLFTEDAKLKFPGNKNKLPAGQTEVTFTSEVTGAPGSRFPSGKNEGRGTITRTNNNIDANYSGTLTTDAGQEFKWTSHEKSKVDPEENVKGEEEVIIENLPGFPQRLTISMETTMEDKTMKDEKKVTNIGYQ